MILWRKSVWLCVWLCRVLCRFDPVTGLYLRRMPRRRFGCGAGARVLPQSICRPGLRAVSAGLGLEASFDLALAALPGAEICVLDPTPGVRDFGGSLAARHPAICFLPLGLWDVDGDQLFHAPRDSRHISHSLTALQGEAPAFTARCLRWTSLLEQLGWDAVDLLKIDIEGAEYRVIADVLASGRLPKVWCIEFDEAHSPRDARWRERVRAAVANLRGAGYVLMSARLKGETTFVRLEKK